MIRPEKLNNALAALNAVLVTARKFAYDQVGYQKIADALDTAEYMPRLIADQEDQTEAFRDALVGLTALDVGFTFALERFDRVALERW